MLQDLCAWAESPTNGGHIFIVPRFMQQDFGRISKFVSYGGHHTDTPVGFLIVVPFLIFYIPPFHRESVFSTMTARQSMGVPSNPPIPSWIKQETAELHRLSTASEPTQANP